MKFSLLLIFFLSTFYLSAQNSSPDLNENFAFEVKSIDDFIERFDFEAETDFASYLRSNFPGSYISRNAFLLSLFNQKNKSFYNNNDVDLFVNEMTDTLRPRFIQFSDYDWYALVECKVVYKKKIRTLELILKVEKDIRKSTKWSIVSVKANFLGLSHFRKDSVVTELKNEYMKNRMRDSSRYFLHPVSHAIDFMNVDEVFSKKKHFEDYLYSGPKSEQLLRLDSIIQSSEIKFLQVNTISYHLLQIKNWILIIDFFNRNEKNSGWLINSLIRANAEQKRHYMMNNLNIKLD